MANDTITMSQNHGNPIISQVNINNTLYDIHDDNAVHTLADLASLGMPTSGIFVFKGTVATIDDLPTSNNKEGDIYHVTENHSEYIWAKVDGEASARWEEFGEHFVVDHRHSIPALSGTAAAQTWTQKTGTINSGATAAAQTWTQGSSSVSIKGSNAASAVTGSGTVNVPTVTETAKYAKVDTSTGTFVKSYPGATKKLAISNITPTNGTASVIKTVTPTTRAITGVSGNVTASKATAGTAVSVAKTGTAKSIPNVTGNTSVTASKVSASDVSVPVISSNASVTAITELNAGSQSSASAVSSWSASVTDGVLSFSAPTATYVNSVTLPSVKTTKPVTNTVLGTAATASKVTATDVTATNTVLGTAISVTPAVASGTIVPYTFEDVTVPVAAEAMDIVTEVTTESETVAKQGTAIGVVTGLTTSGSGATVMTGLGTATTGSALVSAELVEGTSTDGIHTGDAVGITNNDITVNITGTAAAQKWSQTEGTVTIAGTNAASSVTGGVTVTGTNAASSVTTMANKTGLPEEA